MLTRQLAIASREQGQVIPDRLTTERHRQYVELSREMIAVYVDGANKPRWQLHRAVQTILERDRDCPVRRIGAFCKLLDEWSEYDRGSPKRTAELRRNVFRSAAGYHPLVEHPDSILEHPASSTKQLIAQKFGMDWPALRGRLFSDLIENHTLKRFDAPADPIDLLSRYNVAQTQAALLDAVSVRIEATGDWKVIVRQAKLAGLMHRITKTSSGYQFLLDGPASVLRTTHRYGAAMAKFLPSILGCRGWSLTATMKPDRRSQGQWNGGLRLELSDRSGLRAPAKAAEAFDSSIERHFAEAWGENGQRGWSLVREGEILQRGQRVFFPDFVLEHEDGRRVLLEIAGFWTPEYIAYKAEVLQLFTELPIAVAIPRGVLDRWESVVWSPNHRQIVYPKVLEPTAVLAVIDPDNKA